MKNEKKLKFNFKKYSRTSMVFIAIIVISYLVYDYYHSIDILDEEVLLGLGYELSEQDQLVIDAVKTIEEEVVKIIGKEDRNKVNQATMGLIRKNRYGFNTEGMSKYIWSRFAGSLSKETGIDINNNAKLIDIVDKKINTFNTFNNPLNNQLIDFVHMITVIDLELTNASKIEYEDEYYDYLFSWGGDLETFLIDVAKNATLNNKNAEEDYITFCEEQLGSTSKTYFSEEDLLADIDGVNIAKKMKEEDLLLSDAILNYHQDGLFTKRYSEFVESFGGEELFALKVDAFSQSKVEPQYLENEDYNLFFESYIGLKQLMNLVINKNDYIINDKMRSVASDIFVKKVITSKNQEIVPMKLEP